MNAKKYISRPLAVIAVLLFASGVPAAAASSGTPGPSAKKADAVIGHYTDIAHAAYSDALTGAQKLQSAVDALLAHPTGDGLAAAREAWKAARIPYLQTEGFRFANTVVDDWEPRVNAWPLDEGLIDYVVSAYGRQSDQNPLYTLN